MLRTFELRASGIEFQLSGTEFVLLNDCCLHTVLLFFGILEKAEFEI